MDNTKKGSDIFEFKEWLRDFGNKWEKPQSPLEKRFLEDCVTVGLLVDPQYKIGMIHADFAIPSKKIAIECDSKLYHSSEDAKKNDQKRNKIYSENGWTVLRVSGGAIYSKGEKIAEDIKNGFYDNGNCTYIVSTVFDDRWYQNDSNNYYHELIDEGKELD